MQKIKEIGAKNESFVTTGFQTWKNAYNRFREHEKSPVHQTSIYLFNRALKNIPSCASQINKQHSEEIKFNRECLGKIIKMILLLGKQGIAFRGHRETENSENKGNFLEFIEHIAFEYSFELKKFFTNKANANYLSPSIQSELMSIISNEIRMKITKRVRENKFFSIIVDGTTDITRKEQISFCVRSVSSNLKIEERFLGFFEAKDTEGDSLFSIVKQALNDFSLSIKNITGQCYDGASNMSGIYKGLAARVKREAPCALYISSEMNSKRENLIDFMKYFYWLNEIATLKIMQKIKNCFHRKG
ncbi:unnamed protein product [Brachionus calyciflorus]|uniref:DUF4371 domain-containing protein n=1 Tax=Brachionus calyciflorus TaxID=104777 RepID=A0A814BLZ2_9BILA|nr:unnamed protein product [Brachionus calyciflorus]